MKLDLLECKKGLTIKDKIMAGNNEVTSATTNTTKNNSSDSKIREGVVHKYNHPHPLTLHSATAETFNPATAKTSNPATDTSSLKYESDDDSDNDSALNYESDNDPDNSSVLNYEGENNPDNGNTLNDEGENNPGNGNTLNDEGENNPGNGSDVKREPLSDQNDQQKEPLNTSTDTQNDNPEKVEEITNINPVKLLADLKIIHTQLKILQQHYLTSKKVGNDTLLDDKKAITEDLLTALTNTGTYDWTNKTHLENHEWAIAQQCKKNTADILQKSCGSNTESNAIILSKDRDPRIRTALKIITGVLLLAGIVPGLILMGVLALHSRSQKGPGAFNYLQSHGSALCSNIQQRGNTPKPS